MLAGCRAATSSLSRDVSESSDESTTRTGSFAIVVRLLPEVSSSTTCRGEFGFDFELAFGVDFDEAAEVEVVASEALEL